MGGHSHPRPRSADRHRRSAGRGATASAPAAWTAGAVSGRTAISCPATPKVNRTRRNRHRHPHPAVIAGLATALPDRNAVKSSIFASEGAREPGARRAARGRARGPQPRVRRLCAGLREIGVGAWDVPCAARDRGTRRHRGGHGPPAGVPGSARPVANSVPVTRTGDHDRASAYPIGMRRHGGMGEPPPAQSTGARVFQGSKGRSPSPAPRLYRGYAGLAT